MLSNQQLIQTLETWNFWNNSQKKTSVTRDKYLKKLKQLLSLEEVIAVSGVRRCGKSTLLIQLMRYLNKTKDVSYKNMLFVNFEDPRLGIDLKASDLFTIFEAYKNTIKPKGKVYLFLDEVQLVDNWEKFVRTIYDQKQNIKIFVTGSSSGVFEESLSTSLSGRLISLKVFPLDFQEFLLFKNSKNNIEKLFLEFLEYGGFPKVVLEKSTFLKKQILLSYYETILEKDVILKNNIKNKIALKKLALFVISNTGNQVSTYALEKTIGISSNNINRYLAFLKDSYLINLVPRFSYSVKKQIYNPDKVFCVDSGLVNIAGFSFSQNTGRLIENIVFNYLQSQNKKLFYWQNGTEIDLLVQTGIKITDLINITQTVDDEKVLARELNSLKLGKEQFKDAKDILLSLYNQSNNKHPKIKNLLDYLQKSN